MMEAGRAIKVIDPYEWLPGHGENRINLRKQNRTLLVDVEYDGEKGVMTKIFNFTDVCAFCVEAVPGPVLSNLTYSVKSPFPIGSLVEYPDSEAAVAWMQHYGDGRIVKHYSIVFLAENLLLVVFAGDVSLKVNPSQVY
ncbi:MAG: hypothetical protein P4L69_24745 [Desulfosporosinus sp.]|nr:hypothetical protein [Desulfosporosinus sp.]